MTVKIPPRWIVHHDHDGFWIAHEITPRCKKVDPSVEYCRPSAGYTCSTGVGNNGFAGLVETAHTESQRRRARFRDEMQARGKAFQ
jgi:hypothetical protein